MLIFTNFLSFYPIKAAEVVTKNFTMAMLDRGYRITIFVPNLEPADKVELRRLQQRFKGRLKVHSTSSLGREYIDKHIVLRFLLAVFWYIPLAIRGFATRDTDVVVSMYHPTHLASFAAHTISRLKHIPHIIWIRDLFAVSDKERFTLRSIPYLLIHKVASPPLRTADLILFLSEETRKLAKERQRISPRTGILPNMIDTIERLNVAQRVPIERDPDTNAIVFVGEIYSHRLTSLTILLKAMKKVRGKGYNVHLLIIGYGDAIHEFKRISGELGLCDYITMAGKVPHDLIPHYLKHADIAVGALNSSQEVIGSVPQKILEYMVAGLPIINASTSVSSKVVIDRFNGLLVKPEDDDGVAEAIIQLIDNKELRETLGKNGKQFVEENYSIKAVINTFELFLTSLI